MTSESNIKSANDRYFDSHFYTEDETTLRYTRCSVGGGLTSAHTLSFRSGCSLTFLLCCAAVLCFPRSLCFLSCRLWCLSAKRHEACACIVMYLLLINYCQVTICRSCYVVRWKHSCNLWEITFACLTVTAYSACLTMKLPVLNFW